MMEKKSIKEIFNEDVTIKKGMIFNGWMISFFCGLIVMFFVSLLGLI